MMGATTMGGVQLITHLLTVESSAIQTVKDLVAMGRLVWCEKVEGGWLITTEKV